MTLRLRPFPANSADVVSSWAQTAEEVFLWCGLAAAPVPPAQITAWAGEDWVRPFGLYEDERLVAYGELWIDDDEAGVELARLIVDPAERSRGVGRRLVSGLADLARSTYPLVFLRVVPANIAARRCYAAAGFEPAEPDQAAAWNRGQPVNYVWLTLSGLFAAD
jgi:GNAT superfamily N-acetyltransferase